MNLTTLRTSSITIYVCLTRHSAIIKSCELRSVWPVGHTHSNRVAPILVASPESAIMLLGVIFQSVSTLVRHVLCNSLIIHTLSPTLTIPLYVLYPQLCLTHALMRFVLKFNIGNFTQYVRLMACSYAVCCCIVVACVLQHCRLNVTFAVLTAVFFSIQALWDMTPWRWVSDYRRTFETSGTTRPEDPNLSIYMSVLLATFRG